MDVLLSIIRFIVHVGAMAAFSCMLGHQIRLLVRENRDVMPKYNDTMIGSGTENMNNEKERKRKRRIRYISITACTIMIIFMLYNKYEWIMRNI